jgi:hypothetical protein
MSSADRLLSRAGAIAELADSEALQVVRLAARGLPDKEDSTEVLLLVELLRAAMARRMKRLLFAAGRAA